MGICAGTSQIKAICVGEQKIKKAYVGAALVFSKKISRLPTGYTEVEYISSDSTNSNYRPYIDIPATSGAVKLDFAFSCSDQNLMNQSTAYYFLGYNGSTGSAASQRLWCGFGATKSLFAYQAGSSSAYIATSIPAQANTKYKISIDGAAGTLSIDGVEISCAKRSWMNKRFYVFNLYNATSYQSISSYVLNKCKVYYLKLYNSSGELLRDLVPCVNSSGVAGMYDLVKNTFFGSANTSTNAANKFTPGPAV